MKQASGTVVGDPLLTPPGGVSRASGQSAPRRNGAPPARGTTTPTAGRRAAAGDRLDFRPEIEGLRAIAVVAVLFYHAQYRLFRGGYVGVDVFFVVSGYLITRLMLDEIGRTGTISLPRFWARRARRLLPASALVVITTVLLARGIVDPLTQGFVNRSALAAAGFVANILFWTRGGYSAAGLPSPLLHFWSLAVEEQFYLLWPLALWGISRSRGHVRRLAAVVVSVVGVISFIACAQLSGAHQSFAFFWLPTRAWELSVGAGLAVAGAALNRWGTLPRAVVAWAGLAVIAITFVTFHEPGLHSNFPGTRALVPVLATAAIIVGTGAGNPLGPGRFLGAQTMQWIGLRSYALYLWHFPLLVLAGAKWGPLSAFERALVLAVSTGMAALSFAVVENPVRRNEWLSRRPKVSLAMGAGLVTVSVLVAAVMISAAPSLDSGTAAAAPVVVADTSPDGDVGDPSVTETTVDDSTPPAGQDGDPGTSDPVQDSTTSLPFAPNSSRLVKLAAANADALEEAVATVVTPSNLVPSLQSVYEDKPAVYADGCLLDNQNTAAQECAYGKTNAGTTVVLFGDSHAAQWFPALEKVARKRAFRLVVLAKKACPTAAVNLQDGAQTSECRRWRASVVERLDAMKPTLVVMSSYRYVGVTPGQWRVGLDKTLSEVRPTAEHVIILGDTPTPRLEVPSCVAGHPRNLKRCMTRRADAVKTERLGIDYEVAQAHDAVLVTTQDWLCGVEWCPVVIGNVLVYRDESHLTTYASSLLAPYIDVAITPYLT